MWCAPPFAMFVAVSHGLWPRWARAFAKLACERSELASGAIPLFAWASRLGCELQPLPFRKSRVIMYKLGVGGMFSSFYEAMKFVFSTSWMGAKLDLSRITELCALLGNPQESLEFVHIAGTNGKGSTAAMLASVLGAAGYRTGFFTSPPIHSFGERMQVNGEPASNEEVMDLAWEVKSAAEKMQDHPTEFEIITAMSFVYFYRRKCDIVVLEVGLGGRLDATNVIERPLVAVITSIGLDHMGFLGDTKEKIAAEKAGIIKKGSVVVSHPQDRAVESVIRAKCHEESASITFVNENEIFQAKIDIDGQKFMYKTVGAASPFEYTTTLLGEHQLLNAACVIETVRVLREQNFTIPGTALHEGLGSVKWPARFEILRKDPPFVLDVAHNPAGVETAIKTLKSVFPNKKLIFLLGVLKDKDYVKMVELLVPHAEHIVTIPTDGVRGLTAEELAGAASKFGFKATACADVQKGVDTATLLSQCGGVVCALGSLSNVHIVKKLIATC